MSNIVINTIEAIGQQLCETVLTTPAIYNTFQCVAASTLTITGQYNCSTSNSTTSRVFPVTSLCIADVATTSMQPLWQTALVHAVGLAVNEFPTLFEYDVNGTHMAAIAQDSSQWPLMSTAQAQALMTSAQQGSVNLAGFVVGNFNQSDYCCTVSKMTPIHLYCWALATNLVNLYLQQHPTPRPTSPPFQSSDTLLFVVIGAVAVVTLGVGVFLYLKFRTRTSGTGMASYQLLDDTSS